MVEVEDSSHEEEGEVVETPAQEQPPSAGQEVVDIPYQARRENRFVKGEAEIDIRSYTKYCIQWLIPAQHLFSTGSQKLALYVHNLYSVFPPKDSAISNKCLLSNQALFSG